MHVMVRDVRSLGGLGGSQDFENGATQVRLGGKIRAWWVTHEYDMDGPDGLGLRNPKRGEGCRCVLESGEEQSPPSQSNS